MQVDMGRAEIQPDVAALDQAVQDAMAYFNGKFDELAEATQQAASARDALAHAIEARAAADPGLPSPSSNCPVAYIKWLQSKARAAIQVALVTLPCCHTKEPANK